MPKHRFDKTTVTGFAWFDKEQWERLTQVAADKAALDESFEEWERNATRTLRDLERQGHRIERVHIKIDELASWCKEKGMPLNGKARAEYVTFLLRKRDAES